MGMALSMAVTTGLCRRYRPRMGCTRHMRGLRTMNIGTKGIQTPWAMRPTLICAVCWITCPKPKG